jgi:hypothetical protein
LAWHLDTGNAREAISGHVDLDIEKHNVAMLLQIVNKELQTDHGDILWFPMEIIAFP